MNSEITPEHLSRGAAVYVRQSSMAQVVEHTESKLRQYALAESANSLGFASVATIDDDLGRSGSGTVERPGFQKLVALVCSGSIGAVFCIEASRLARNGRDWHHLIDLCAMVGTLIVDPDGVYDPRLVNNRLLLGLKGSMSEYELSLLRQRSQAVRDSKAKRGELRFSLPPGYCWDELGKIDLDDASHKAVVTIHWNGGRHTELRVARRRGGGYPEGQHPSPVEVIRKLGGQWPDRELAVTYDESNALENQRRSIVDRHACPRTTRALGCPGVRSQLAANRNHHGGRNCAQARDMCWFRHPTYTPRCHPGQATYAIGAMADTCRRARLRDGKDRRPRCHRAPASQCRASAREKDPQASRFLKEGRTMSHDSFARSKTKRCDRWQDRTPAHRGSCPIGHRTLSACP